MKNGMYATCEKLAKALPQPFFIDDVLAQFNEHQPELISLKPNLINNIRSWASGQVKIGKLFKLPQNGGKCKRYSFDPADKTGALEKEKICQLTEEKKTELSPTSDGLVRFKVVMPPNCSRMTIEIDGIEYTVIKGNEYGL